MMSRRLIVLGVIVLTIAACTPTEESAETTVASTTTTTTTEPPVPTSGPPPPPMELTSPAFSEGETIPTRFTCDGDNVSPQLDINPVPDITQTLAIIVDDPDAPVGTWVHWVEYDIPAEPGDQTWPENVGTLGVAGSNSWNLPGYGGPCPPQGENHRYFFKVYALDSELIIPEGIDADGLRSAMEGHIVAEAELMGTYSR